MRGLVCVSHAVLRRRQTRAALGHNKHTACAACLDLSCGPLLLPRAAAAGLPTQPRAHRRQPCMLLCACPALAAPASPSQRCHLGDSLHCAASCCAMLCHAVLCPAQDIEERVMMIRDAVLDSTCQLLHDPVDAHQKNLFG